MDIPRSVTSFNKVGPLVQTLSFFLVPILYFIKIKLHTVLWCAFSLSLVCVTWQLVSSLKQQTHNFFDSDFILPYVDASEPPCTTFTINLFDCWSALQKAKQHKLIDMSKFNCREFVNPLHFHLFFFFFFLSHFGFSPDMNIGRNLIMETSIGSSQTNSSPLLLPTPTCLPPISFRTSKQTGLQPSFDWTQNSILPKISLKRVLHFF